MINTSKLIRDRENVKKSFVTMGDKLVAGRDIKIYIPYRYFNRKLATLGEMTSTVMIFCVMIDDVHWDLCALPNMVNLTPVSTTMDVMDDEEYMVLTFPKGSTITPNGNLVRDSNIVYNIYDGFYSSGYCPWFIGYMDYGKLLQHAGSYGGLTLSHNNNAIELTVAQIAKNPEDRSMSFRKTLTAFPYKQGKSKEPFIAPLQSVLFNANNTSTRIVGAYLNNGILSALTYPSTRSEPIEEILRS